MNRRDCIRFILGSWGFFLIGPESFARAAMKPERRSMVDRFLGEELIYHIGYWLISRCGEGKVSFVKTDLPGIYRVSLQGRAIGLIDALLGPLRYSYESYARYSKPQDRLEPLVFQLMRRRSGRERRRMVIFDYAAKEIVFSRTRSNGETRVRREPIKADRIYEDYLTLAYNFRHGCYGPLKRGADYQMPLHMRKQMKWVKLHSVTEEEAEKQRQKETIQTDKDFFMQFRVDRKDISSGSGEVEGWISSKAIPVKGTLKDVILFGDLWGELIERRLNDPNRVVAIPDSVKSKIHLL